MLLTTPTSLSFLGENCLRANNSSSHNILLSSFIFITLCLSFYFSLSPSQPPSPIASFTFQHDCHQSSPAPIFYRSTLSWSSQCSIDFYEAFSCHISISLNSNTHSIALCLWLYLAVFLFPSLLFNLYFFYYSQSPSKCNPSLYRRIPSIHTLEMFIFHFSSTHLYVSVPLYQFGFVQACLQLPADAS